MNIDILDQLVWLGVNTMDNHVDDTCRAAADEIKRLRAELDAEGNDSNLLMLEIERLRAERDTERALADQLADALRWQADPYQKGTLMMSHRALDAYEEARRG